MCLFVRLGSEVFNIILPETNGLLRACDGAPRLFWMGGIIGLVIRVTGLCRGRLDVHFPGSNFHFLLAHDCEPSFHEYHTVAGFPPGR